MSLTGQNKTSVTLTPPSKNSVTLAGVTKTGEGWLYDQADIEYDMPADASGRVVFYDGIGEATVWTPQSKNSI